MEVIWVVVTSEVVGSPTVVVTSGAGGAGVVASGVGGAGVVTSGVGGGGIVTCDVDCAVEAKKDVVATGSLEEPGQVMDTKSPKPQYLQQLWPRAAQPRPPLKHSTEKKAPRGSPQTEASWPQPLGSNSPAAGRKVTSSTKPKKRLGIAPDGIKVLARPCSALPCAAIAALASPNKNL